MNCSQCNQAIRASGYKETPDGSIVSGNCENCGFLLMNIYRVPRGGTKEVRLLHTQECVGSIPTPATI